MFVCVLFLLTNLPGRQSANAFSRRPSLSINHQATLAGDIEAFNRELQTFSTPSRGLLFRDGSGSYALHYAVEHGGNNIFRRILELDPSQIHSKTASGELPIHLAARSGIASLIHEILVKDRS